MPSDLRETRARFVKGAQLDSQRRVVADRRPRRVRISAARSSPCRPKKAMPATSPTRPGATSGRRRGLPTARASRTSRMPSGEYELHVAPMTARATVEKHRLGGAGFYDNLAVVARQPQGGVHATTRRRFTCSISSGGTAKKVAAAKVYGPVRSTDATAGRPTRDGSPTPSTPRRWR